MSLYSHVYTHFVTKEGNKFSIIPDNESLISVYTELCKVQETMLSHDTLALMRIRIKYPEHRENVFI